MRNPNEISFTRCETRNTIDDIRYAIYEIEPAAALGRHTAAPVSSNVSS